MPDGAGNPCLAAAVLLHARRFGVEGGTLDPEPQPVGGKPKAFVHVPPTLADALDTFERDEELREALGSELVTAFVMLKRAEWERYEKAVSDPAVAEATDRELDYYQSFF